MGLRAMLNQGGLGWGLRSRLSPEELTDRLAKADHLVLDLDECLIRGYGQAHLAKSILTNLASRPLRPEDKALLPGLVAGGAFLALEWARCRALGVCSSNMVLIERFIQALRGVPREYFDRALRPVGEWIAPGAREALIRLSRGRPLGLISFTIDIIALEVARLIEETWRLPCAFVECNRTVFTPDASGRPRFVGYATEPYSLPQDKEHLLQAQMDRLGLRRPLVVGHGKDELAMAALARQAGGLSLGVNAHPRDAGGFDVLASSWWRAEELAGRMNG